ncbi:dihydroorotase [Parasphingorhabdus cellanae]|uniref:Amidohydrolase family protein n=1 Tax=Parasphingorhabdus cellanae TaxID=2806553 RepID=A0ABX7T458_9SPHN|nr:dihydroorotase [Parasphingorhabdus cellanae]QTD56364.1 amidohydrolase family protein [Parasphingorhabdus cellanae]
MKQVFTDAQVLVPGAQAPQSINVATDGDRICRISEDGPSENQQTIDCKGAILAPGIIDLGVFSIDKPAFHYGGITRAALMPDQSPVLDLPAMIKHNASEGKPDLWSHPLAAATKGLKGAELAEIGLMKQAGARAVATGRSWIADSGIMLKLLHYCHSLDMPVIVHSEDRGLTANAVATAGETATRLGLSSAPATAEALSIARDIALVRESGAHVHFRQVTTAQGLDLIRAAKSEGLPVTCGITPAHLFLSDIAISEFRTFAKLSPPLRSEEDRQSCLKAIEDGTIDVISSGHDPRGPEDKRLPFAEAEFGMAGAETLLALSLNLVRDGLIGLNRLFELLSATPAKILGVEAGQITEGYEADLIVIDPEAPWQIDTRKMAASAGNTPFDKLPVQGRVHAIYKGGKAL